MLRILLGSQQTGLILVTLLLGAVLSVFAGYHVDRSTGELVNNFLNSRTLMQTATDASFFVIMAVGATMVIISGGIDLSVGSIYALSGVLTAMVLRSMAPDSPLSVVMLAVLVCVCLGLLCGLLNGVMVVGLRVHPFIVTLGTMWVFRGIAFVISEAESILVPQVLTDVIKLSFGSDALYPMPMIIMLVITAAGAVYLSRTVMGRHIFAVGGNLEASRYAGLRIDRILVGVYVVSGLTASIAALVGSSYYGSASCADATGYELYVIASAVVGGASLRGGRGSAVNAMLGAMLIVLIRQSIRTLHLDQNYEWVVIGCAIIVAVVLDQVNRRLTARRLVEAG
ncbi:MAG: ABC transporter permease [Gemmatimonadetes bacterium]|nr:ABC transporter permease [Gemmatimonadota bacterium]